tara:strand:- start:56 stop:670 length:615 start_codon:yes stop_codon:yes gene_type:complete
VRGTIDLLLFDLGGVLIDLDFSRMYRAWAAHSRLSPDAIERRFRMDEAYERHERGELDAQGYFAHLRGLLELEGSDEEVGFGWNQMFVGLIEETVEALKRIGPNVRMCAFTNSNRAHERYWRSEYAGALEVFEHIFVSSTIRARKPEREAFEIITQSTGVRADRTLFFDDTPANVEGALAAGLRAVRVNGPDDVKAALREAGFA